MGCSRGCVFSRTKLVRELDGKIQAAAELKFIHCAAQFHTSPPPNFSDFVCYEGLLCECVSVRLCCLRSSLEKCPPPTTFHTDLRKLKKNQTRRSGPLLLYNLLSWLTRLDLEAAYRLELLYQAPRAEDGGQQARVLSDRDAAAAGLQAPLASLGSGECVEVNRPLRH